MATQNWLSVHVTKAKFDPRYESMVFGVTNLQDPANVGNVVHMVVHVQVSSSGLPHPKTNLRMTPNQVTLVQVGH